MFYLLTIFWFIRTTKAVLFYLYLWQLKEYHVGRFIDHFRTAKGKKLIVNWLVLIKLIILLSRGIEILVFVYFIETIFVFKNIFQKKLKKPVLTSKTALLVLAGLTLEVFFVLSLRKEFVFWLLLFDILVPLIVSLIILISQPLTVLLRDRFILEKAREKRKEHKNLVAIGITGSFGKTSTKEYLAAILSSKFNVLKTKEHQNSEVGISQCIINELGPEHEIFIAEMGAYNRGGIKLLSGIVKHKIGILAGINEQHLALFWSQNNIIKAKYELIENLAVNGLAIFNGDNKYCSDLYNKTVISKKLYKSEPEADIWAQDIRLEKESILFKVKTKQGEEADFKVNVLGKQNVPDILGAVTAAKALGMSLEEISRAALSIKPEQGAMRLLPQKDNPGILDSSYSANPDGVIADLDYLETWPQKKIIVMPCLIELGKASKMIHKRIGRKVGQVCDLAIITTKERFKDIKQGAVEAGIKPESILFIEDAKKIVNQIKIFSNQGDIVLLEGRIPKEVIKSL